MINIKTKETIKAMREGGKILAHTFEELAKHAKVGVSASFLDKIAYDTITRAGAEPSFLGYQGYKYTTCISKKKTLWNTNVGFGTKTFTFFTPLEGSIIYPRTRVTPIW